MTEWNECFCVTKTLLATQLAKREVVSTEDGGKVVGNKGDWLIYHETEDGKPGEGDMPLIVTDEQYRAQFIETNGNLLIKHLPELIWLLVRQLRADHECWGDTWRRRPAEGQEARVFARFRDYWDQWRSHDGGLAWLKIIGNAWICILRVIKPELLLAPEGGFEELP